MRKLHLKKVDNAWKRKSANSKGNLKIVLWFSFIFFAFKVRGNVCNLCNFPTLYSSNKKTVK